MRTETDMVARQRLRPRHLVAGLCAVLSVAQTSAAAPAQRPAPAANHVAVARHIYGVLCSACHEEQVGPNLRGLGLPPQLVIKTVRHGQSAMPAFAATEISDPDLAALAQLISASAPKRGKAK